MGNTSSNSGTAKAHKHHSKHGDITCTRRHHHSKHKHRRSRHKRSHFGRRTRRYRGGTPSSLRHSISANPEGSPTNSSPPYPLKIGSRQSRHRSESSLRDNLLREKAIKQRKEEEKKEKEIKMKQKYQSDGYLPIPTKPGSRFTVSDKKHKRPPPMSSFSEEEEE
jgi:hypothetical protein